MHTRMRLLSDARFLAVPRKMRSLVSSFHWIDSGTPTHRSPWANAGCCWNIPLGQMQGVAGILHAVVVRWNANLSSCVTANTANPGKNHFLTFLSRFGNDERGLHAMMCAADPALAVFSALLQTAAALSRLTTSKRHSAWQPIGLGLADTYDSACFFIHVSE